MNSIRLTDEFIDKANVQNVRNFLIDRGITAASNKKADLNMLAEAAQKMKPDSQIQTKFN